MKKGANKFAILALLVAVIVGGNMFSSRIDRWRFPWGYPSSGRPTLTGSWVGSLRTATGLQRGVIIDMKLPDISGRRRKYRRSRYGSLEGTARTCDESGLVRAFTVSGAPENRDATRLHLTGLPVEKPALNGLRLGTMQGTWDQANTLHIEAQLYVEKDGGTTSGADYPDTEKPAPLHMTHGGDSEFRAVCARIKQPG